MTDLRPYFMQIFGYNSENVHRIPTNLGTAIRFNEPFKYAKFHPDWSTHSCFMADFAKCAKRSRRKKPQNLAACISEMAGAIFFKYEMWISLPSQHYCSNFGFDRIKPLQINSLFPVHRPHLVTASSKYSIIPYSSIIFRLFLHTDRLSKSHLETVSAVLSSQHELYV